MFIGEDKLDELAKRYHQLKEVEKYTKEIEEQCVLLGFEIALRILGVIK